jgi:outer membrane protein insertion porin family
MAKSAKLGICCFLGFLLLVSGALAQQATRPTIERIDVRGNRRINVETCRFYIQSREGDPYDESRLEYDLRSLYKANFFENIEVQESDGDAGKIITFIVKEKPLIRAIEYVGNKSFTESNILDEFKERKVGLTVDSQYEPSKIRAAERSLKNLMIQNGKPLGTVHSEIEKIPPSSVRVRFVMDEGTKVRIGKIRFVGNKLFSESVLKNALKMNKEHNIFTMFKGTDKYHAEKLEYDLEVNLKAYYQERGYMQVQIGQPVTRIFEGPRGVIPLVRKTREQFFIEVPIDAGDQFRVGKLELQNCGILDCAKLATVFGMHKGEVINYKRIKDTLENIKKLYGNLGFINWSYLPEYKTDNKDKTIDILFDFQPDKQFFVHRINFAGNTKTRDKVMRREFVLEEGRIFSSSLLDASVMRLNQLGYFDKIEEKDYEVKPDDKTGLVDVNLKVKEKSQRSIGFTGGVSGISGSFLGVNYSDNNFMGRGESLDVSFTGGTRETNFVVSFTEPYLLDTRWTMGVQLFDTHSRYDTYSAYGITNIYTGQPTELFTQKTAGSTVTLSRRLGRSFWSMSGSYTFQRIGISNIAPGYETFALGQFTGFTPSNNTQDALNGILRSEITPSLGYNSTNGYFNPSRGTSMNLSMGISGGPLGGDFSMIRPSIEVRHFFPDKWLTHGRNVFGFRFIGQYIQAYGDSSIPFYERLFIGGENTIRGFDIRSISPLAISSTPQYDSNGHPVIDLKTGLRQVNSTIISIGGDTTGIFNFEYRVPVAGPLSVAAFYDTGISHVSRTQSLGDFGASRVDIVGSTNNALRSSTGLEIQFVLPVVSAPIRLIFAYNPMILDTTIMVGSTPLSLKEPRKDIKFSVGRSF